MRIRATFIATWIVLAAALAPALAQDLYWDVNGATPDGSDSSSAPGTWGVDSFWTTDSTGALATGPWIADRTAIFSAGGNASGTFDVTVSGTQQAAGITIEEGTEITIKDGTLALSGAGNVTVTPGSAILRIDSVISGVGVNYTGAGILILGGANTYSGPTSIGAGSTLKLGAAGVIPDGPTGSVVTLPTAANNGAIFQLNGFNETVTSISGGNGLTPASTIALGANTLTLSNPNGETFNGLFTSSAGGKIVKEGSGSITLVGQSNGFVSGEFVLNAGNVAIGNVNIFGTSGNNSKLTINGGSLSNSAPATGRSMSTANIDIGGSFAYDGTGTANVEWLGTAVSGEGTAVVTLKAANPTITINQTSTGTFIFRGPIGDEGASRGFTKSGNGVLTLNHPSSTYGGATTILQGQLRIDANASLGNGQGAINLSGGSLNSTQSRLTTDPTPVSIPIPNPINLTANSIISTTFAGATTPPAPTSEMELSSNSIGGTGGTLTLRNDAASGGANPTNQFEPRFSGNGFDFPRPIEIAAGLNSVTRTTRLNTSNATGTQTFSGIISGPGKYRRMTAGGTTKFTAANTFSGGTDVEGGTLTIEGTAATAGAGNVAVTGGVLQIASGVANAILDTATLSISGTGKVDLGASINELVAALSLGGMSQLGGTYGSSASAATNKLDQWFTGTGILTIPLASLLGDFNSDGKVDAADYAVWRENLGTMTMLPNDNNLGTPIGQPHYDLWLSHFGSMSGSGSGAALGTAVPEPTSLWLVAAVVGWTVAGRRRRVS